MRSSIINIKMEEIREEMFCQMHDVICELVYILSDVFYFHVHSSEDAQLVSPRGQIVIDVSSAVYQFIGNLGNLRMFCWRLSVAVTDYQ